MTAVPPQGTRREIRSARYPYGLPDRCDLTVWEAFTDAWLLLVEDADGLHIAGVAEDYDAARRWLAEQDGGEPRMD